MPRRTARSSSSSLLAFAATLGLASFACDARLARTSGAQADSLDPSFISCEARMMPAPPAVLPWAGVILPIDGPSDELPNAVSIAERLRALRAGTGSDAVAYRAAVASGTWTEEDVLGLARDADQAINDDGLISGFEMKAYFKRRLGVDVDDMVTPQPGDSDAVKAKKALFSILRRFVFAIAAAEPGATGAVGSVGVDVLPCDQYDLAGHDGIQPATGPAPGGYKIWLFSAKLLHPQVEKVLCANDDDVFRLYVPEAETSVSECGIVNGLYTARYYGLDTAGWADNWASSSAP
jgi:hypothetical protein